MGQFSGPLRLEEVDYELWDVEPFSWTSADSTVISMEEVFRTDLASVPQIFRTLVPKIGYWSQAAVIHDLLYYRHRNGLDAELTRLKADKYFLEGIQDKARDYNVSRKKWRHWQIYHAVRLGGLEPWETPDEKTERLLNMEDDTYE